MCRGPMLAILKGFLEDIVALREKFSSLLENVKTFWNKL